MKVKLEIRNVRMNIIAEHFEVFGKLSSGYKLWLYDGRIFAYFKIMSNVHLKELIERLIEMKNIVIIFHRIEVKGSWLKNIRYNLLKN